MGSWTSNTNEIGYWIDRAFWGRGVLQKCGFTLTSTEPEGTHLVLMLS